MIGEAPLAPLALFAYNRPEHTARCLASLAAGALAPRSVLHVFVDGPRDAAGGTLHAAVVAAVEAQRGGFAQLHVHRRERNFGLAANVIVLEDDLVCAAGLLDYLNAALRRYAHDARVGSIHAYCYPGMPPQPEYFFLEGADCWGWATWRDRWQHFEADGRVLLRALLRQRRLTEFTLGFSAPYLRMLCRQILGRNNSWAVRWHASLFLRGQLTLYPATSFVQNTGLDGSGTHCDATDAYQSLLSDRLPGDDTAFPSPVHSRAAAARFRRFFCGDRGVIGRWAFRGASLLTDMTWVARVLLQR